MVSPRLRWGGLNSPYRYNSRKATSLVEAYCLDLGYNIAFLDWIIRLSFFFIFSTINSWPVWVFFKIFFCLDTWDTYNNSNSHTERVPSGAQLCAKGFTRTITYEVHAIFICVLQEKVTKVQSPRSIKVTQLMSNKPRTQILLYLASKQCFFNHIMLSFIQKNSLITYY